MEKKYDHSVDGDLDKTIREMRHKPRIHFVNDEGKLLFELQDDTFLRMISGNGEESCVLCNYVSEEKMKIDGRCVEIKEFVRRMKETGIYIEPLN